MNFERCMKQKCKNCKYNNKCFKDRQNKKTKNDKHKKKKCNSTDYDKKSIKIIVYFLYNKIKGGVLWQIIQQ